LINLPDGSIVFVDHNLIRRSSGKRVETILTFPIEKANNCYLALDSSNNEVYVSLSDQVIKLKKLEKVRDSKSNYRVIAGCETDCLNGDNKAKSVKFEDLKG
jgi:hypothetical protein